MQRHPAAASFMLWARQPKVRTLALSCFLVGGTSISPRHFFQRAVCRSAFVKTIAAADEPLMMKLCQRTSHNIANTHNHHDHLDISIQISTNCEDELRVREPAVVQKWTASLIDYESIRSNFDMEPLKEARRKPMRTRQPRRSNRFHRGSF